MFKQNNLNKQFKSARQNELVSKHSEMSSKSTYLPFEQKTQYICYRKRIFIKSIKDRYQNLRIIIFSILLDCYLNYDSERQLIIQRIKQILFKQAKLNETEQNIQCETKSRQLLILLNFIQVRQGETTEKSIMMIFNSERNLDKFIMIRFKKQIENHDAKIQNAYEIMEWFKTNLKIKMEFFLFDKENNPKPGKLLVKQKTLLIQSLRSNEISEQSASFGSTNLGKQSEQIIELTLSKSISPLKNASKNIIHISEFGIQNRKIHSFWDYLCCNQR